MCIKRVPVEKIYNLMKTVFEKAGVPPAEARICSDVLIASDLRGIESHGVGRLKMYYDRLKEGIQFAETRIDVINDRKATAVWDGNHGMGHVISKRAMQTAIDKAGKYGMGSVAVRNSTHFGIDGYYSRMAADQDMIGMSFTNARPSISPTFGVKPMLGTNPISFAAPSDREFHFLYDGATSIIQRGKIEVFNRAGKDTPAGWAIDEKGEYHTDTKKLLLDFVNGKASLLALGGKDEFSGGHKGYGLATIVEILSSALQGGSFMYGLSGFENGKKVPYRVGHFFMAINIDFFIDIAEFKKITGAIMLELQNSDKQPDQKRIFVAGEKEFYKEKEIREIGIPVNPALQKNLQIIMKDLDLEDMLDFSKY